MKSIARLLKVASYLLLLALVLLLVFINRNLAGLAETVLPGSAVWTHLGLLLVEGAAAFWLWRGVFGGQMHLLLLPDDTPEARERFAVELARRLEGNPLIREAGLSPADPQGTEQCVALLRTKADEEIESTARRVFLATALSQNGKLDALIVLVSVCRLVWRVARIYNQRPHPREIASLYRVVATSTFLALSLEELDISTEVGVGFSQAVQAMAPAGITSGIPFAGRALQIFTTAAVEGTANCYLTLRAGIVARNAYDYGLAGKTRPSRAAVFREAGGMLLGMTTSLMDKLAAGVASSLAGAVKGASTMTVEAGKGLVKGVGSTAGKVAMGTGSGVVRAGSAAVGAASTVADTAASATRTAISGAVGAATTVADTAASATKVAITGAVDMITRPVRRSRKRPDSDQ